MPRVPVHQRCFIEVYLIDHTRRVIGHEYICLGNRFDPCLYNLSIRFCICSDVCYFCCSFDSKNFVFSHICEYRIFYQFCLSFFTVPSYYNLFLVLTVN